MVYADVTLEPGAKLPVPAEHEERAMYVAKGTIRHRRRRFREARLLVLNPGEQVTITAVSGARVIVFGGEPMEGPRYIWWNFVSRSKERIEQAKADWRAGRFPDVPGESEFIPLPD